MLLKSATEAASLLSFLDYLTFALSFTVVCILPIFFTRSKARSKNKNLDYLLMGRKLTLPLFVTSLVATWYGGIFGVTRISYEQGIYNFLIQGVFWYGTYFIFAFFVVDKIFCYPNATSLADLVRKLYGNKAARICALFNFFDVVPVVYIISLALFLSTIFGGNFFLWMLSSSFLMASYTAIGGFRSIIVTDFVQFFAMMFAIISVVFYSFLEIGSPLILIEKLPKTHLDPMGGESIWQILIWGIIALSTLADPNFYQRCLACPNPLLAKKGILYSILFWFLIDCCTTLSGLYARVALPNSVPQNAYLLYSLQILPEGIRGLFCVGIVATIVSTLDSYLFVASQALINDLLGKNKIILHRIGIYFTALLGCILAYNFDGNIKEIWKFFGSLSASCLLIPILLSLSGKIVISEKVFSFSCLFSASLLCFWRFAIEKNSFWWIEPFYIGCATSLLVCSFSRMRCLNVYWVKKKTQQNSSLF